MRALRLAMIGTALSVNLAPCAANAAFTLPDEAPEVAFCKSLPRPPGVTADINTDDYCGCWVGSVENGWSEAEYNAWKAAQLNKTPLSPNIAANAKQLQEQCISLTTPVK